MLEQVLLTSLVTSNEKDFSSWHQPIVTPTGCPTILVNSDTKFLGLTSGSPQNVLTSNASHKCQVPGLPTFLSNLATKSGGSHNWLLLQESTIHQKSSLNSGKHFTYYCQLIIMDTNEEPDEEVHRVRAERVPSTRISIPLEVGCATLPACGCVRQVQSSLNPVI